MFFGHSQGGLNGPLFLAGSSLARGAVLSGAGSDPALNLLEKTKPADVAAAFRALVRPGARELATERSLFPPVMTAARGARRGRAITRSASRGSSVASLAGRAVLRRSVGANRVRTRK